MWRSPIWLGCLAVSSRHRPPLLAPHFPQTEVTGVYHCTELSWRCQKSKLRSSCLYIRSSPQSTTLFPKKNSTQSLDPPHYHFLTISFPLTVQLWCKLVSVWTNGYITNAVFRTHSITFKYFKNQQNIFLEKGSLMLIQSKIQHK